jgi:NAD(P)H-hydrate epimerase
MHFLPKLPTVAQTRAADAHAIEHHFSSSLALMESAANAFVAALLEEDIIDKQMLVVCGPGNNGGDGLAVARLLRERDYLVDVVLFAPDNRLSPDAQANLDRLNKQVITLDKDVLTVNLPPADLIIDALFGTGLNRPVTGLAASIIEAINTSGAPVYAIDLPSGLFADGVPPDGAIVRAELVISFQRPKPAFFLPENNDYLRRWRSVDIGLDEDFLQGLSEKDFVLDETVSKLVKPRTRYSHKGTYGHALLLAGSRGKIGAAVLCARACLRAGAGLLTARIPGCGYEILQATIPEAMCLADPDADHLTELPPLHPYSVVAIGPGIGQSAATADLLRRLLEATDKPVVLDADALNLLAAKPDLLKLLPSGSILTPHIKEFTRLAGEAANGKDRYHQLRDFARQHRCIVVLKDAHTCIATPTGERYFNTSGNPGMATGGMGDVLTGIITGLLAQGYEPLEAALLGVYFHGRAGDAVAEQRGQAALLASDVAEALRIEPGQA